MAHMFSNCCINLQMYSKMVIPLWQELLSGGLRTTRGKKDNLSFHIKNLITCYTNIYYHTLDGKKDNNN